MSMVQGLLRTHNCGELRKEHEGQQVTLCGWVNKYRDLGAIHFIDIRDKFGLTQLGFESFKGDLNLLKQASLESVILAKGKVGLRPPAALNSKMPTGDIEVQVEHFEVLSPSDINHIPFLPFGSVDAGEDLKLKYRYLDLRTQKLQDMLKMRSDASFRVRQTLFAQGFTEVETPVLYKSTPEGARDYIVPSRVHPGKVYALPQSPQTLKQLLMIGGTDKYFQITKCFRDEDLRADRQPEFTQIDIEVSYPTMDYMKNLSEKLLKNFFNLPDDFILRPMSFQEGMEKYGSDKPDIRFGLEHVRVTDLFTNSEFATFSTVAQSGGLIKAIFLPESCGTLARKDLDKLNDVVKPYGGKGVAWFKSSQGQFSGGVSKFMTPQIVAQLHERLALVAGDAVEASGDGLWFFCADASSEVSHASADALRRFLGTTLNLKKDGYHFLWVYDFPLLEWSEEHKRFVARHHPFTSPKKDDFDDFMNRKNLEDVRAEAYDVVCNGYELGGGSLRIYNPDVQAKMFSILGFSDEEARYQFGFFIDALKYGTPPHGGIAFGMDRLCMLLAKTDNIRDVIAFPKTTSATDLMAECPSVPGQAQLDELSMRFTK